MRTTRTLAAALALILAGSPAWAQARGQTQRQVQEPVYKRAALKISAPWVRASESKTASAFMTIENGGKTIDRLIAASSLLAKRVSLQRFVEVEGAMMRRRTPAIDVPAGGKVVMVPGEYHLLIVGLKRPLAVGQKVKLTLTFEQAGAVSIVAPVLPPGTMTAPKPSVAKPAPKGRAK